MKKIVTLFCALGLIGTLSAQTVEERLEKSSFNKNDRFAVERQQVDRTPVFNYDLLNAPAKVAEKWDTTLNRSAIYHLKGSFNQGVAHGYLYYLATDLPYVYAPYNDTLEFRAVYRNNAGNWHMSGVQTEDSVYLENDSIFKYDFGVIPNDQYIYPVFPTLTDVPDRVVAIDDAGDSTYTFKYADFKHLDHQCGAMRTDYPNYADAWEKAYLFPTTSYCNPMTLCGMQIDSITSGGSGGSSYASSATGDMYRVGIREEEYNGKTVKRGKLLYGTFIDFREDPTKGRAKYCDSIGVYVPVEDVMYIDTISLPIFRENAARKMEGTVEQIIPTGATITIALHPIVKSETGWKVDLDSVIARATATNEDFIQVDNNGVLYACGTLGFAFKEVNALGVESVKPAIAKGDFMAILSGFNDAVKQTITNADGTTKDSTAYCDFGIFCDYYQPYTGSTFYIFGGKFTNHWRNTDEEIYSSGKNIALTFNAMFPTLLPDSDYYNLGIEANGGYSYYQNEAGELDTEYGTGVIFRTNLIDPDEWEIETDADWLEFALDDEYVADYSAMVAAFYAEANTADEARTAKARIGARGKFIEFTISQPGGGTAVDNVKVGGSARATYSNGKFHLSYGIPFNTIELYSVSGQKLASYPAAAAGRMTLDAEAYANGVYLINFVGNTRETVRVIK